MVTTNQKSIIDMYTQKRKRSPNVNTKDSHQIMREENKRGGKAYKNKSKKKKKSKIFKKAVKTYIWIITLNVNTLNALTKT